VKVKLLLEVAEDAGRAPEIIEDRLVAADVDEVEVAVREQGAGFGEPVTIVVASIVVTQGGAQLVHALRRVLQELRGLKEDWAQLRGVKLVTAEGEKDISEVTAEDLAEKDDDT
jgi:hypothetical protein